MSRRTVRRNGFLKPFAQILLFGEVGLAASYQGLGIQLGLVFGPIPFPVAGSIRMIFPARESKLFARLEPMS
jgi:hypothetical protein